MRIREKKKIYTRTQKMMKFVSAFVKHAKARSIADVTMVDF